MQTPHGKPGWPGFKSRTLFLWGNFCQATLSVCWTRTRTWKMKNNQLRDRRGDKNRTTTKMCWVLNCSISDSELKLIYFLPIWFINAKKCLSQSRSPHLTSPDGLIKFSELREKSPDVVFSHVSSFMGDNVSLSVDWSRLKYLNNQEHHQVF